MNASLQVLHACVLETHQSRTNVNLSSKKTCTACTSPLNAHVTLQPCHWCMNTNSKMYVDLIVFSYSVVSMLLKCLYVKSLFVLAEYSFSSSEGWA